MANNTIYPYGTEGSLPSSIGIINDLSTGGSDQALSAEMGKFLNEEIAFKTSDTEYGETESEGVFFVDSNLNIGAKISNAGIEAFNLITSEDL